MSYISVVPEGEAKATHGCGGPDRRDNLNRAVWYAVEEVERSGRAVQIVEHGRPILSLSPVTDASLSGSPVAAPFKSNEDEK